MHSFHKIIILVGVLFTMNIKAQDLPLFEKATVKTQKDWLIEKPDAHAELYQTEEGYLVFSNALVSRTFTLAPNGATIGLDLLTNNESFLRSVRPEAIVEIDGMTFDVGGLIGQPIHNYLLPEWVKQMKAAPVSFKLSGYHIGEIKERFPWKKRLEWMPKDMAWPPPGKELIFSYKLDDEAINHLMIKQKKEQGNTLLFQDDFKDLSDVWTPYVSTTDHRNSLINEGKAGEIMALANTAVFAEINIPPSSHVFIARIDPGTDNSVSWGPGLGLRTQDRILKINLRPKEKTFGFFDGHKETISKGMKEGQAAWLKLEISGNKINSYYSYDKEVWVEAGSTLLNPNEQIIAARLGKMDWSGAADDHQDHGLRGRCRMESLSIYGIGKKDIAQEEVRKFQYLHDIQVDVHYELYDHMPVFCKWITVKNGSDKNILINTFKSEILALIESESSVDNKKHWNLPNISIETDYNFGGMSNENVLNTSMAWNTDPLYKTQVNYDRETPCLLEVYPKLGPAQDIAPLEEFHSYRAWELVHDSWDQERKGLEKRRMMRVLAPWITENPILMHVRSAEEEAVKLAIDQCAEVGFEKVIMTFGSGFNAEDESDKNIHQLKELTDYAHSKGITLGGYSLLASRSVGGGNDVQMPQGQKPCFGNSPCIESEWGHEYFRKMYALYEKTGMDNFEHDGSYPGDVCSSENHPGHKGLEDSQWNQYQRITEFYKWCRSQGIYLNVPDYYFLSGSNKTGMGYRETNWSLPRAQQEIIERQNIYDGTWSKTPSMGWMFVPLVQYHGGGQEATIEPLKEHLPHYEQRFANLFGAGVQACYRGPQLFDAPETKELVKKWVDFYKENRQILDADIIHIRRPDGRDYDAILHVDPSGETKGLLMVYNPLNEDIKRTIKLNLYYCGIQEKAVLEYQEGQKKTQEINPLGDVFVEIEIPANSQTWIKIYND